MLTTEKIREIVFIILGSLFLTGYFTLLFLLLIFTVMALSPLSGILAIFMILPISYILIKRSFK